MEVIPFPGDQRSAEGAHDPGNIRPDGVAAGDLFKAPQYGIVVEGAARTTTFFPRSEAVVILMTLNKALRITE